ncbi:MAG: hypothetical protein MJ177_00315 [Clostridia bacterium]|nr:hypothetical protein [Clostridia bacterium]
MRCKECNVDLAKEYTKCPLCGAAAVDEPPVIEDIETAPYPRYSDELLTRDHSIKSDFPFKYILRAVMPVCAVLWIIYFITKNENAVCLTVPVLTGLTAAVYFFLSLKEKGRLLHYSVSLTACAAFQLVMLILSAVTGTGTVYAAVSFAFAAVLFILLFALRTKRMSAQLHATFKF